MFIALVSIEDADFISTYMKAFLEVAIRIQMMMTGPDLQALAALKETSLALLSAVERQIGSTAYIGVYSDVQRGLQTKRAEKKRRFAADAVINPQAFASRKVMMHTYDVYIYIY